MVVLALVGWLVLSGRGPTQLHGGAMEATAATVGRAGPRCDWDFEDWGGGGSGQRDPQADAFVIETLLIACSVLLSGPLAALLNPLLKAAGRMFMGIPVINLIVYVLIILLRDYPGERAERFVGTGLVYTIVDLVFLLLGSLLIALIVVTVRAIIRWSRSRRQADTPPPPPAAV